MLIELLIGGGVSIISALSGFFVAKKINSANFEIYLEQSKAKAKAIEYEAELLLQNSKIQIKELEDESKKRLDLELSKLKGEYEHKFMQLDKKELSLTKRLEEEHRSINLYKEELRESKAKVEATKINLQKLEKEHKEKLNELLKALEAHTGLTRDEAKKIILDRVESESRDEIARIVRKYENEAKTEAKKRANYILAQATTRFAGEFAAERLINVVHLANDDLKGRIIGKEGRNIKTLEMLMGVDIIIDDTPNAIVLSSFNLYRRAIATKTVELLVEDGRIQPSKIEEIYEKVKSEFDEKMIESGESVVLELGIGNMHPELMKLIGKLKYRASYGQNALGHSLEVAYLAGIMASEMGGNEILAKRAGILHDIGKALTQEYSGNHVDLGAEICKRYKESDIVINAIYAHHGHEEPKSIESASVCAADTLSAARPGARKEVLESFLKRVQEIEDIATSHKAVTNAYAINAGREIRVIANAELIHDDETVLLSKEIAKEIEAKVQYPGEIKVTVIRELRAIEFAR